MGNTPQEIASTVRIDPNLGKQQRRSSQGESPSIENPMLVSQPINLKNRKCEFVYIKPIALCEATLTEQDVLEFFSDKHIAEKEKEGQKQNVMPAVFEKEEEMTASKQLAREKEKQSGKEDIDDFNNSLEHLIAEQNSGTNGEKIPVYWSSFIKVKKKNYLEDYIHIKQIGQGAFGNVSKIKMKYGGLLRAAKIIKRDIVSKVKAGRNKLISEITVPMKTDHPNLNKLYEVFQWKNQYVLVMELCDGGDLFCKIKAQKTFSEVKVANIMKQILSGVVYLHNNNIVHRDLKPENMLYDNQGKTIKITDFGTAIELLPGKKLGMVVGSPFYIAPEVLSGSYTEKCDVWSCGIILYILLSGCPPFLGHREEQILTKIRNDPVKFDGPIWSKRSKESKHLVAQMLNKNYLERPSAHQILNSEWMKNTAQYEKNEVGAELVKNLSHFHFQNKLKAVVYTYIASQLYSSKDKEKLLQVFQSIDQDGDGVIAKQELIKVFQEYKGQNFSQIQVENILHLVDTNGSGLIDFTQFLVAASNEEELLQKKRLQSAFTYLDSDHSGYITAEEILPFLDNSNQTELELKKIFEQVDDNGDGKISRKQFVALLLKNRQ